MWLNEVTNNVHLLLVQVLYNYKLRLDSDGNMLNSDCECPAGKGPHASCKHIASVALMLAHFVDNKMLLIGRSCTEELQAFHKPKRHHDGMLLHTSVLLLSQWFLGSTPER